MALRHLQLLRNSSISQLRDLAKSSAGQQSGYLKDGDVIVARYLIQEGQGTGSTNVAIAVGHKVGGEGGYIVWNDNQELKELISASTASTENLEKAVGVAHNASAITFDSNSKYIGTSNSASGAIQSLDTNLYATSGKVDEVRAAIGSSASTLGVNGHYVETTDTVKDAVTDLDNNLFTVSGKTDSGITAFNNYTTQVVGRASGLTGLGATGSNITTADTVQSAVQKLDAAIESGDTATDNLRQAVGAATGASTMAYASTTKYIKNDTTVKAALETLDGSLNTVSGDLDTLESTYASYTATTNTNTADTRTMATNLDTVVGVASGSTSLGVDGNYVKASGTVKEDITVLDSKLKEVSASSTTDVENLRKAVGVQSGDSAITIADAHYATGKTVVTALTQLDTQLYSATTKAENAQAALGSTGTTLGASGKYVSSGQTAKAAVETLDSNLYTVSGKAESALTYVGNIDSVVGVQNSDTAFTTTGKIASAATTVKGAVEALDGAIVDLSGKTASDDDLEALVAAVGATKGQSTMAFTGANYISAATANTVSGALMTLDSTVKGVRDDVDTVSGALNTHISNYNTFTGETNTKINTISGKVDNAQTALGTTGTTLGVNGNYVTTNMTVQTAVDTLDDVEKATRDTIGVTGSGSGLSLTTQHYISGDTTVVSALTDLDTNLYELSGSVTQNKVSGTNPIVVTTASTGTTVSLKINSAYTDSSVTTAETADMHKNIILTNADGLYAVADLHYEAVTNKLKFVNSNGTREIQLTGVQVFENCYYDEATESIKLVYTDMSGGTGNTVTIPVGGIIEEYDFQAATGGGAAPTTGATEEHNVYLWADRSGKPTGKTEVYGEISIFDCGTY